MGLTLRERLVLSLACRQKGCNFRQIYKVDPDLKTPANRNLNKKKTHSNPLGTMANALVTDLQSRGFLIKDRSKFYITSQGKALLEQEAF